MEEEIWVIGWKKRIEREWLKLWGNFLFFGVNSLFPRMHLFKEQGVQISTVGWTISEIQTTRWIKVALKHGKVVGACRAREGTGGISRSCDRQTLAESRSDFRKSRKRKVVVCGLCKGTSPINDGGLMGRIAETVLGIFGPVCRNSFGYCGPDCWNGCV